MLPTEIVVLSVDIDAYWEQLDEYEQEDAISDFLSDKFGFCHNGFSYEEIGEQIRITNIQWDEDD